MFRISYLIFQIVGFGFQILDFRFGARETTGGILGKPGRAKFSTNRLRYCTRTLYKQGPNMGRWGAGGWAEAEYAGDRDIWTLTTSYIG